MGKRRERKCTQCGNTFSTKKKHLDACDSCCLEAVKTEIDFVNTPMYRSIQEQYFQFCEALKLMQEQERETALMIYWAEIFNEVIIAELGLDWTKYQEYLQLFDFPEMMHLNKEQFNQLLDKVMKGGQSWK